MACRRSARLFHREGLHLNNTPGKTSPKCLPLEVVLLIAQTMVDDAEISAQPLTWNATYDSRNDTSPKLNLNLRQRRLASLRFKMIRDVCQINQLFRQTVLKVFLPDFEVFHRGKPLALAVVLPGIDTFDSCHVVINHRTGPGVAPFVAQLAYLQPAFHKIHLRMRPQAFVYALVGGRDTRYRNPMAAILALKEIIIDEDCRGPKLQRHNRTSNALNHHIPSSAKRLQAMEKSLGTRFHALWQPYSHSVRMFVKFCDTSEKQFELVSTVRGLRIRIV